MKKILHLLLLIIIFISHESIFSQEQISTNNQNFDMGKILNKKKITIVITDSGLGGMSVCAGIENKLNEVKAFEEINLIYFNSHAEKGAGYNSMPSTEVKARVFDSALKSMEEKYSPDLILIACNTLSVVYSYTQFAQVSKTPVLGIVDFGVSMVLSELKNHKNADVIILGTPTTIKSGSHKQKLVDDGIKESQILNQACPNLESEIQDAPKSEKVKELIHLYLNEAVQKLDKNNEPIITTLCCTHYGFSMDSFQTAFKDLTQREAIILNPNELMIDSVIPKENWQTYPTSKISVSVVSRALINENEKQAISELIISYAPLSASALLNYEYNVNLFEFNRDY